MGFSPIYFNFLLLSSIKKSYYFLINGAKAPDLPNYPFYSQLKLTAINIPSFACQPLIRINYWFLSSHDFNVAEIPKKPVSHSVFLKKYQHLQKPVFPYELLQKPTNLALKPVSETSRWLVILHGNYHAACLMCFMQ